jgi:hypothetical protein
MGSTEWLSVGRDFHAKQAAEDRRGRTVEEFEQAAAAAMAELTWHQPVDGTIEGPMSPVMMLQAVIRQMGLGPVVGYAYGGCLDYPDGPGETATFSLLGVEIETAKQRFRLHLLDTGLNAVSLRIDWIQR